MKNIKSCKSSLKRGYIIFNILTSMFPPIIHTGNKNINFKIDSMSLQKSNIAKVVSLSKLRILSTFYNFTLKFLNINNQMQMSGTQGRGANMGKMHLY